MSPAQGPASRRLAGYRAALRSRLPVLRIVAARFLTVALRNAIRAWSAYASSHEEPLAELAAYSRPWYEVPEADLVRLRAAARAAGYRWDAIWGVGFERPR